MESKKKADDSMLAISRQLILVYQRIMSPFLGTNCRFYPSCSHYAYEALGEHGVIRGWWMAIKRLAKCHPFNAGGIDFVERKPK